PRASMNRRAILEEGVVLGAGAGVAGGLVFAAAMTQLGVLPTLASLVRTSSPTAGFLVHMMIATAVGAGFGALVWHQRPEAGETLFWGLAYGAFWWFLGALTLLPLLLGQPLGWNPEAARRQLPSLFGHLLYGAVTALALVLLRRRRQGQAGRLRAGRGALVRGMLAGLAGAWLLGRALDAQDALTALSTMMDGRSRHVAWLGILVLGVLAGLGYALLYPKPVGAAGPTLIRGTAYGFVWWVTGALTLLPLIEGSGLAWSIEAVRTGFATLPGYLLFLGGSLAIFYHWLTALVRILFSDDIRDASEEGAGTRGLRAVGRGALAGLAGGLLFTVVMVQIGFLPTVAALIGSRSALTGLAVHLLIANIIGSTYGLLFRRQSYDVGSALGWGLCYGFFWWLMGPLTLMPVLLGSSPQWSAGAAAASFPALVGHLAYGACLGVIFYRLESRYNPWWITRTQAEATRAASRREQVLTSAPALWALMVLLALTIPILLGE
ncbi:MAG: hypothetical protein ACRD0D_10445, partial [Acidimicrobiales bacterium]